MKQILAALCITLTLGIFPAFAAPPATITYQGYLTNSGGAPVSGSVAMILSLYDAAGNASNTPLWSESQPAVTVANGVYTVQLGSITTLNLPFDTTYYLGVAVGGESEMVPRLTLTSAPTVFRAMAADSADKLNQPCGNGQVLMYASASSSWGCITPGALATRDTIADAVVAPNAGIATSKLSGAVTAITNHGLGTAATLNTGTAAGNLVQLDASAQLPAVDGSQLANVTLSSFGNMNTKAGAYALTNNTSGGTNVAFGYETLGFNTTGSDNSALGYEALMANTTASNNTAIGNWALHGQDFNNSGVPYSSYNVAIGGNSLATNNPVSITTGIGNTAIGFNSLYGNSTGTNNIGIGYNAGAALTTGDNNITIGNVGFAAESNTIRIGDSNQNKTFIAGIRDVGSLTGVQTVVIDANGQLGSVAASGGSGTVTQVTASAPLSVTNGTTTPAITLGTVPLTNGGTGTTNGSITGTGALTFTAGSTNANINLTPSGTGTVDVATKRITNLATPTGNTDATTKAYVDSKVGVDARFGSNTSLAVDGSGADCTIGSVWLVAGRVAGGMPCNGTSLDKTVHAAVFSLLGYTYGGSGNNFNLPDLRAAAPNGLTYVICVNGLYPMQN